MILRRKKKKKTSNKRPLPLPLPLHLSPSHKSLSSPSHHKPPSSSPSLSTPTKKKKLLQVILNTPIPNFDPNSPNSNPNHSPCLSPNFPNPNPSHSHSHSHSSSLSRNPNSPNPNFPLPIHHPHPNSPSCSGSSPSSSSSSPFSSPRHPHPTPPAHLHPHYSHNYNHHQQQLLLQQQKQEVLHQQTQKLTSELHRKLQQQHLHHLQLQQHHPELLQHLKTHIYNHQNTDLRQEEQGLGSPNPSHVSSPNPNHNIIPNPNPKRTRAVFRDCDPLANGADKMEPLLQQGKPVRNAAMETPTTKAIEFLETSVVPTKKALRGVLEELQKKDKFGVFSEPVDAKEVPEYHNIIKEPMDFGTMKKRIAVGYYADLSLFEKDVFKICSNAMKFNAMGTIYYKQARAIKIAAERCFGDMRTKFASAVHAGADVAATQENSMKRSHKKKPSLKMSIDNPNSDCASEAMLNNADYEMGSQADPAFVQAKINGDYQKEDPSPSYLGKSGEGRRPLTTDESRRNTFKPLSIQNGASTTAPLGTPSLQFVPAACQFQFSYARSLAWFASDLGPDVWKVVEDKIRRALPPGVPFGPGWVGERGASGNTPGKTNITVQSKQNDTSSQSKLPHLQNDQGVRNGSLGGDSLVKEIVRPEVSISHPDRSYDANLDCPHQPKGSASELQADQGVNSDRMSRPAKDGKCQADMHPIAELNPGGSSERMMSEREDESCQSSRTAVNNVVKTGTNGRLLCTEVNPERMSSLLFVDTKAVTLHPQPASSVMASEGMIQEKAIEEAKKYENVDKPSLLKSNYSESLQNGQVSGTIHT